MTERLSKETNQLTAEVENRLLGEINLRLLQIRVLIKDGIPSYGAVSLVRQALMLASQFRDLAALNNSPEDMKIINQVLQYQNQNNIKHLQQESGVDY